MPTPAAKGKDTPPESMAWVNRIWPEAGEPAFTGSETYLVVERKLALPDELCGRVVRHHPRLLLKERDAFFPGMVVCYGPIVGDDPDAEPCAIQRWYFGEDGLALRNADGRRIKKMLGSTGGAWLAGIEALTIFADHDGPGLQAAVACRDRWCAAGREVLILRPPKPGADAADLATMGRAL